MSTYLPGSASVLTAPGSIPGSEFKQVWIGLVANLTTGASVTFWQSSASTDGASVLATLTAAACTMTPMMGPFNLNASGLYVGNIESGSAIVWMR